MITRTKLAIGAVILLGAALLSPGSAQAGSQRASAAVRSMRALQVAWHHDVRSIPPGPRPRLYLDQKPRISLL
jgi:hypothetical protein